MSHSERVTAIGAHRDPPTPTQLNLTNCREQLRAAITALARGDTTTNHERTPPDFGQSEPTGTIPTTAAITARDAALIADLRAAALAYEELIAVITHEVKTPLTVIRGHAQLTSRALRRGDPIDPVHLLETMALIDASTVRIAAGLDSLDADSPTDEI